MSDDKSILYQSVLKFDVDKVEYRDKLLPIIDRVRLTVTEPLWHEEGRDGCEFFILEEGVERDGEFEGMEQVVLYEERDAAQSIQESAWCFLKHGAITQREVDEFIAEMRNYYKLPRSRAKNYA